MPPLELALEVRPTARVDVIDVRARAVSLHGSALERYARVLYTSHHTTAGYLPQRLAARLSSRPGAIRPYLDVFRIVGPGP